MIQLTLQWKSSRLPALPYRIPRSSIFVQVLVVAVGDNTALWFEVIRISLQQRNGSSAVNGMHYLKSDDTLKSVVNA